MQNNQEKPTKALIAIDCQHDFVDGSLACREAEVACERLVELANRLPEIPVYYSADDHSPQHMSFKENGGTWPPHCVQGTKGAKIVPVFSKEISEESQQPGEENLFYKGRDDATEEYSAFAAKREDGAVFHEVLPQEVWIGGIASEFCVRETCLALKDKGFNVHLLKDCVGYVDQEAHERNLKELEAAGISVVTGEDLLRSH